MTERTLLLTLTIPDDLTPGEDDDPGDVADELARIINDKRALNATARAILAGVDDVATLEPITVGFPPPPQWVTAESIQQLRERAATVASDVAAVLTVYDEHVPVANRGPWRDRLAIQFGYTD